MRRTMQHDGRRMLAESWMHRRIGSPIAMAREWVGVALAVLVLLDNGFYAAVTALAFLIMFAATVTIGFAAGATHAQSCPGCGGVDPEDDWWRDEQ